MPHVQGTPMPQLKRYSNAKPLKRYMNDNMLHHANER